jgi:hypothetical protein
LSSTVLFDENEYYHPSEVDLGHYHPDIVEILEHQEPDQFEEMYTAVYSIPQLPEGVTTSQQPPSHFPDVTEAPTDLRIEPNWRALHSRSALNPEGPGVPPIREHLNQEFPLPPTPSPTEQGNPFSPPSAISSPFAEASTNSELALAPLAPSDRFDDQMDSLDTFMTDYVDLKRPLSPTLGLDEDLEPSAKRSRAFATATYAIHDPKITTKPVIPEPRNYRQVLKHPLKEQWLLAMEMEFQNGLH